MTLDIEYYLTEVTPDNICGVDLLYDSAFVTLEQAIKGKPEQQMGSNIQEAEPPNWREVRKNAEALLAKTRDLRILIHLLRALIATEGLLGLRTGCVFIEKLVQQRWDCIHPQLDPADDNDPTERVNILMSLCDHETILRPLQWTPLLESKALGKFSLRDINIANGKITSTGNENVATLATIEAAVQDSVLENIRSTYNAVSVSLDSIDSLESFVTEQVGVKAAPNFDELRNFLKECKTLLSAWLDSRGIEINADLEIMDSDENQDVSNATNREKQSGEITNSQDALNALKKICDYYKKNEPSSPVPILLERCMRLVGKNFMDVLKDIAPGGIDQATMIMGVRDKDD